MADNAGKVYEQMKNLLSKVSVLTAIGFAALLVATPATAETSLLRADIPFAFVAGDVSLPAGQYVFKMTGQFGVLQFWSQQDTKIEHVYLKPGFVLREDANVAEGKLIFRQYGNTYVLNGVWGPDSREGRVLKTSKTEIELAKESAAPPATVSVGSMNR